MTPQEVRALAARVMAGENTDDLNEYIFNATAPHGDGIKHRLWQDMNGKMRVPYGMFFRDLNAADALMAPLRERGWHDFECWNKNTAGHYGCMIYCPPGMWVDDDEDYVGVNDAPTEAAARVALALLCLAAEGECGRSTTKAAARGRMHRAGG